MAEPAAPKPPLPPAAQPAEPTVEAAPTPSRIVRTRVLEGGIRAVPRRFELCEVDDLIALIAAMLTQLIAHNDQIPLTPTSLTRFHSRAPPGISVREYLERIARYTNVEHSSLLILLFYVDRVCEARPDFTISSLTVHRFVIAAVACGSKALSDSFCTNTRYARVGGVSLVEMNLLERELLSAVDWRLTTNGSVLDAYYTSLIRAHAGYCLDELEPAIPAAQTRPDALGRSPSFNSVLNSHRPKSASASPDAGMDVDEVAPSPSSSGGLSSSSASARGASSSRASLTMSPRDPPHRVVGFAKSTIGAVSRSASPQSLAATNGVTRRTSGFGSSGSLASMASPRPPVP